MRRSPEPAHPPQHSPQSQPAAALPVHDPCPEHSSCKRPHRCRCGPSYLTHLVITQPVTSRGFLLFGRVDLIWIRLNAPSSRLARMTACMCGAALLVAPFEPIPHAEPRLMPCSSLCGLG